MKQRRQVAGEASASDWASSAYTLPCFSSLPYEAPNSRSGVPIRRRGHKDRILQIGDFRLSIRWNVWCGPSYHKLFNAAKNRWLGGRSMHPCLVLSRSVLLQPLTPRNPTLEKVPTATNFLYA